MGIGYRERGKLIPIILGDMSCFKGLPAPTGSPFFISDNSVIVYGGFELVISPA